MGIYFLMKYRVFLVFLFLLPVQVGLAAIYMTHANDHLQFSDKPSSGAQLVTLEKVNYFSSSGGKNEVATESVTKGNSYTQLELVQPQDQQTFQNQQQISVEIFIQPTLRKEDSLELWVDGSLYQKSQDRHFLLSHLTRGEHRLEVHLIDAHGKILLQSSSIVVFVHYAAASQ